MPKAVELLRQGKHEELWQMCCGYLQLNIKQFMAVQERLLLEQLELLNNCPLGEKIMRGAKPKSVEEFRKLVPLTTYADYCPELEGKQEDVLPAKTSVWAHSSGRSGEYTYKWIPITQEYSKELSIVLYGIGMLSSADGWGDTSHIPPKVKILNSVAPRPYISGTFADVLRIQTPITYMPTIEESEYLTFEERLRLGFEQSVSRGFDYFFGLSLVLASVGEKFMQSSNKYSLRPYLKKPKALWRLARGKLRSRLAGRPMLPKDIWSLRGIIGSGLDSQFYKDRINEMWGRKPLDLYSCTEGGIIATQTWDYEGMTFIPNLNFLEFIPEDEIIKWQMDRSYQLKTLLLDEVEAGECYELVFTNFHGGAMTRYRIGDLIRITSLRNESLGIELPQMAFEHRVDDVIDFIAVKITEKNLWQAIRKSGVDCDDWVAYKKPGEPLLHLFIEPKNHWQGNEVELSAAIRDSLIAERKSRYKESTVREDWRDELGFDINVKILPSDSFSHYLATKQADGADLAHLKPPHINPSQEALSLLMPQVEEILVVTKTRSMTEVPAGSEADIKTDKISV